MIMRWSECEDRIHRLGKGTPHQQKKVPQRRGPPPVKEYTTETPPRDEPLYSGNGRGSKPVKKTLAHNFDFSGFTPLLRQVYDHMAVEDAQISRKLPFTIYQHAMVECLNAFLLHQAKYVLKTPELQSMMDPLVAIGAAEFNIPTPIYDYICGLGPTITPTGDKVYLNLPSAAIPKIESTHAGHAVRSGSFGPINAANHNVYECYFSPYVTSEYITRCGQIHATTRNMRWALLPAGWHPANGVANENFLGYRDLIRLHADGIRKCQECSFDNSESVTGLLCHSSYVMTLTSGVIGTMKNIRFTIPIVKPSK